MNVAVTGGAGFIGRHLVRSLSGLGHSVVVLDNLRRGAFLADSAPGNVREMRGDVRDLGDCMRALHGAEVVVHLAAQANVMGSESDPDYAFQTNIAGTWNVARAAMESGTRHFVFASSREVYGNPASLPVGEHEPLRPHNLYGASKVAAEAILGPLRSSTFGVSIVRLSNVIGPGDRDRVVPNWLEAARARRPLIMFGGTQELDLVTVDLVVQVLAQLVDGTPLVEPVNVASGTGTRLKDLAAHILAATGSDSLVEVRPPRSVEVTRFRADISRLTRLFAVGRPADPLGAIRADW